MPKSTSFFFRGAHENLKCCGTGSETEVETRQISQSKRSFLPPRKSYWVSTGLLVSDRGLLLQTPGQTTPILEGGVSHQDSPLKLQDSDQLFLRWVFPGAPLGPVASGVCLAGGSPPETSLFSLERARIDRRPAGPQKKREVICRSRRANFKESVQLLIISPEGFWSPEGKKNPFSSVFPVSGNRKPAKAKKGGVELWAWVGVGGGSPSACS